MRARIDPTRESIRTERRDDDGRPTARARRRAFFLFARPRVLDDGRSRSDASREDDRARPASPREVTLVAWTIVSMVIRRVTTHRVWVHRVSRASSTATADVVDDARASRASPAVRATFVVARDGVRARVMGGLARLRDERGNGTDFWASANRAAPWTSLARERARRRGETSVDARVASSAREGDGARGEGGEGARAVPAAFLSNDRADDDDDDDDDDAEEDASLEHAPTVFIGYPHASLLCPRCRDVMASPVCARDGTTYCARCAPSALDGGANEPNAEIEDAIQSLPVLCRRGLTMRKSSSGAAEWVWRADGCRAKGVRLRLRDVHDGECDFALRRCYRPYSSAREVKSRGGKVGRDYCGALVRKNAYATHAATCEWRAVTCDEPGCEDVVPLCRMKLHALTCSHARMTCPNECSWEGKRMDASAHARECPREYVKCGFIDLEHEDAEGCLYGCERARVDEHRSECDFRPWTCPNCEKVVNAMRAAKHAMTCAEARRRCPRCRAQVRVGRFDAHVKRFCTSASRKCAFATFGCLEQGSEEELRVHETESAARHLRLVVRALDDERENGRKKGEIIRRMDEALRRFGDEYARLTAEATERVRFVEMKAIEEVERVKARLESSTMAYDAHATALKEEIQELRADRDAATDADAHLAKLDVALTQEQAQTLVDAARVELDACNAQMATLNLAIESRDRQWREDVADERARERDVAAACRKEALAALSSSNEDETLAARMDALSTDIREISRTLNLELLELSEKQNELETLWRDANANPRFAPAEPIADERVVTAATTDDDVLVSPRRRFKHASASERSRSSSGRRFGPAALRGAAAAAAADADASSIDVRVPPPPSFIDTTTTSSETTAEDAFESSNVVGVPRRPPWTEDDA